MNDDTLLKDTDMDPRMIAAIARAGIKPTVGGLRAFENMRSSNKSYYDRKIRQIRKYLKRDRKHPQYRQHRLWPNDGNA